ncbi:unnamed protein product [[Candida] boidinii]|nr:unnamed protein product [[Candida] boidinii]
MNEQAVAVAVDGDLIALVLGIVSSEVVDSVDTVVGDMAVVEDTAVEDTVVVVEAKTSAVQASVVEASVVGIVVDSYFEEFDFGIAVEEVGDDDEESVVVEAFVVVGESVVVEESVVFVVVEGAFVVCNNHYYIEDYDLAIDLNVDIVPVLELKNGAVVIDFEE